MATPVLQGSTIKTSDTTSTTDTITLPSSIAAGDLILVFYSVGDTHTVATPGGWTLEDSYTAGNACEVYLFSKVAAGGETTQNFTLDVISAHRVAIAARVDGQHASTWKKELKRSVDDTSTTNQASGVTDGNGANEDLALVFTAVKSTDGSSLTATAPSGFTEAQDGAYVYGWLASSLHSKALTASGTVGATVPFSAYCAGWRQYILLVAPVDASGQPAFRRRQFLPHGPTANSTFRRGI